MKWAFSTETAKRKKKQKNKQPTCLESLNSFASKMIKEHSILLFPSAKSNCGFIGLHSWETEATLRKTNQKFYSEEGGNRKLHLPLPLS